jgi:hypothetical protein
MFSKFDAVKSLLILTTLGSIGLAFYSKDYRNDYKELALATTAGAFAYLTPKRNKEEE